MATQILKTLQRVIFPSAVETDVVPLYVDEHLRSVPNKCERKP